MTEQGWDAYIKECKQIMELRKNHGLKELETRLGVGVSVIIRKCSIGIFPDDLLDRLGSIMLNGAPLRHSHMVLLLRLRLSETGDILNASRRGTVDYTEIYAFVDHVKKGLMKTKREFYEWVAQRRKELLEGSGRKTATEVRQESLAGDSSREESPSGDDTAYTTTEKRLQEYLDALANDHYKKEKERDEELAREKERLALKRQKTIKDAKLHFVKTSADLESSAGLIGLDLISVIPSEYIPELLMRINATAKTLYELKQQLTRRRGGNGDNNKILRLKGI